MTKKLTSKGDLAELCDKITKVSGLIYFSPEKPIQCAPEDFTPIFFNFKKVLNYPEIRTKAASGLLRIVNKNVNYICGLESGGNYYASYIADKLNKPLIFLRRNEKKFKNCGDNKRIVGTVPTINSTVAIIDDVFATALTTKKAINYFGSLGIRCEIYTLFSYGHNKVLGEKLNIKVKSLIMYEDLIKQAELKGILNEKEIKLITQHINKYDKYI